MAAGIAFGNAPANHAQTPRYRPLPCGCKLEAGPNKLKSDLNTFGFVFETMAARDLHVYAQSLGGQLCHYRDNSGLEIDSIIELDNGGYAAIEVKLGADQEDEAAANLIRFARKMEAGGIDAPASSLWWWVLEGSLTRVWTVCMLCLSDVSRRRER